MPAARRTKSPQTPVVRIKLKAVGSLTKYGYHANKSAVVRRAALKKAAEANGYNEVVKRLNVLYIYNKNRHPELAAKYKLDMTRVQAQRNKNA